MNKIYQILSIIILIIGFISGCTLAVASESISIFLWTMISSIIISTFIMGIYSICTRLDIIINKETKQKPKTNSKINNKYDEKENLKEIKSNDEHNNGNDENKFLWE